MWRVIGVVLLLSACGSLEAELPPVSYDQQLQLSNAQWTEAEIVLEFSQRLTAEQLSVQSLPVFVDVDAALDAEALYSAWHNGEREAWSVSYVLHESGTAVSIVPHAPFPPGRLAVLLTSALRSQHGVPFVQFASDPQQHLILYYTVTGDQVVEPVGLVASDVSLVDDSAVPDDVHSEEVVADVAEIIDPEPGAAISPDDLVINEVLYDVAGSDTDGVLFIELRGEPGTVLGGITVQLLNGDGGEETGNMVLPDDALMPSDGLYVIADARTGSANESYVLESDFITNFDPQNGPDAIRLLAADGRVLDTLGYGAVELTELFEFAPAADAPADMSVSRLPDALDSDDNSVDFVVNAQPSSGNGEVVHYEE